MSRGKYGAVIGLKEPIAWKFILGTSTNRRFPTNHSAVFRPPYHQNMEFRQTTVFKRKLRSDSQSDSGWPLP